MPNGYNVIVVKNSGEEDIEHYEEGDAGGTVLPGDCIKLHTDGTYIRNTEADVAVELLIATEDMQILEGNTIADAYASGDRISFVKAQKGMEVQVRITTAQNLDLSDYLTPNNAGKFKAVATTEARLLKSLETDASTTADDLILCRVL